MMDENNIESINEIKDAYFEINNLQKEISKQFKVIKEQTDSCLYKTENLQNEQAHVHDELSINSKLMDDLNEKSRKIRKAIGKEFISLFNGDIDVFKKRISSLLNDVHRSTTNNLLKNIAIGDYDKGQKGAMGGIIGKILPEVMRDKFDPVNLGKNFASFITGFANKIPGRDIGGPVNRNNAYKVGEYGPEIFVPDQNGKIIRQNNNKPSPVINLTINTPNVDSFRKTKHQIINEILQNLN